jgi:hypothetical protein
VQKHFYLIPLSWLQAVVEAGDLDTRELLLACVVDGQIIFAERPSDEPETAEEATKTTPAAKDTARKPDTERTAEDVAPETTAASKAEDANTANDSLVDDDPFDVSMGEWRWHQAIARERPFFSRRTYEAYRKQLIATGLLRKYQPQPGPPTVTKTAWQALQRGIKYTVADWPPQRWIYRPHTYLVNRWPVWLGNSDLISRLILLALLAEFGRLLQEQPAATPSQVVLSWQQLRAFVTQHLGETNPFADSQRLTAKVRKGLQELLALQAITELEPGSSRYALTLAVFDQPPQWSIPALAQRLAVDVVQERPALELLRTLMMYCWEPVTSLRTVWAALQALRQAAAMLDESDWLDLQKFVRTQRQRTPPLRHSQVLADFLQERQSTGPRLVSAPFVITPQELTLVKTTSDGAPLSMPAPSPYGLAATQLWVRCERSGGLTVQEAQAILAESHWLIWQAREIDPPLVIVLPSTPPRALSVDFGYVLPLNQLHRQLDYGRPFELILRALRPEPRLKLHCRFRLLRMPSPKKI